MLIGITGKARSGKDTLAGILLKNLPGYYTYALADPIKECVNACFTWDIRHSDGRLKEVVVSVLPDPSWMQVAIRKFGLDKFGLSSLDIVKLFLGYVGEQISPRKAYQIFGTEVCRNNLSKSVWTDIAPTNNVIISDARFPNEAQWLAENGGTLIGISRKGSGVEGTHESESYVLKPNVHFDNNGTIDDLEQKIIRSNLIGWINSM